MQNQTVVENESSVFNLTTLYRESHANQTTYSQTIKEFAKNVWVYKGKYFKLITSLNKIQCIFFRWNTGKMTLTFWPALEY